MKNKLLSFLKAFIPFSIILCLAQYYIVNEFFDPENFYYSTWTIYLFNVIAALVIYLLLLFVHKNYQEYTGYTFMGCGLLKMLAAILFLLPMLTSEVDKLFHNILAFFIPYFLYLIFETLFAVKLLNAK